jgi:tRNA (cmo5U34)-methyltransferase
MLEKMGEFFDKRLDEYEEHQLNCIESAREFYKYTAKCLPKHSGCWIIDLGCGTGLELDEYFRLNPSAKVTGIDMASGMLKRLREKHCDKELTLILGSYFDVPFGIEQFDAAVSVESLHHFTADEKRPLYEKLHKSLKTDGYFILTDYLCPSDEEELFYRKELLRLKAERGIKDNEFYHYDTPLTVDHEIECLLSAGFSSVEILNHWGATYTIKAIR